MTVTDWNAKQAARAVAAAALHATHPHLVPANGKGGSLIAAAKNIRTELARAFPGVAFSVKSKRFSMGDSVDVRWTDGPTTKQVDAIINRYSAGSFDGMTDSYTYDHCAWTDAFGDAKYVHSTRSYSDNMVASILRRIGAQFGVEGLAVEAYKAGKLWNMRTDGGIEIDREVNLALSRHTYCMTVSA